jgi:neutral ceramidase
LKHHPGRTALRAFLAAAAILVALLAVASLPWRAERPARPPRVVAGARGTGGLAAGAAEVRFALPAATPIGGFARLSYASVGAAGPVGARALVLSSPGCKVAIASAEILLVPESLEADVRARVADLRLDGVVVAATHTHAGPGGFWDHALGERIATGPYDAKVREAIVAGIAEAIRRAAVATASARVSVGRGSADDLARSRSGGTEDAPLTVVRLERLDRAPVAELTVFAAHPTILGKANRAISGDWPGRFLAGGAHGLRLFVHGAIGDQSVDGPAAASPDAFADALSRRVDALSFGAPDPSPPLAFAAVEAALPAPEPGAVPGPLRRAARTLAFDAMPPVARVQAVRIGPALLVAVPGEPVARVAVGWRAALPADATIVSLAGGYIGYVEAPDRMATRGGETRTTYYGPELAARLGAAVRAAAEAVAR